MVDIRPLTMERWSDFEALFGSRGACGGCWCMYWRQTRSQFKLQHGELNRVNMKTLVGSGVIPGLIAYDGQTPLGWCSIAPRPDFTLLAHSRILKPVDDQPVWSVVCFFVERKERRKGLSIALLKTAVEYAYSKGASIVEGYPVDPKSDRTPDIFVYTGLYSAFQQVGFVEVIRRSSTRPLMRYYL